jgi:hypothetical protein
VDVGPESEELDRPLACRRGLRAGWEPLARPTRALNVVEVDFEALLRALHDGGVEFVVVGGFAATLHGSPRLTRDLDVVYRRSPENMERLASALSGLEPYLRGAPPGLPFRWDPLATSVHGEVFGMRIRVVDLSTLIRVKRAAGRPKDLETIAELEALLEERERGGTGRL